MPPQACPVALAAATIATLLVACNGQDPALTPPEENEAEIPAAYNEADVQFLQGMRPHHEEAIATAELVPERTEREELNQLAQDITSDQTEEVALIEELLAEADVDPETAAPHDMGGMMGEDAVEELAELDGEEFEHRFMEMMIQHHRSAIDAADEVVEDGQNARVGELARSIRSAQSMEIMELQQWQRRWFGS